jgi:copper ion binding protein
MITMVKKIYIEGMSCGHCVKHVEEALKELKGVTKASVSLKEKYAVIEVSEEVSDESIKSSIDDAGYEVIKIEV